jgi:hypothetical protein
VAGETPIETGLSDRELLLHILQHVEHLSTELERWRPLLQMIAPNGAAPDAIGAAQAWRAMRRGRRGAPG